MAAIAFPLPASTPFTPAPLSEKTSSLFKTTPTAATNGSKDGSTSPTSTSDKTTSGTAGVDKVAYTDDDADVKLKSNDGRVFKVHSYLLKAHSTHFRDQFKSAPPTDAIPIDLPTKQLKLLLDLMHMKPAPSGAIWAYRHALLTTADDLGLKGVAERILFSMHETVDKDPWAVFCLASQRYSLALARSALRALATKDDAGIRVDRLTPDQVKDVALPYLLGIFAAALKAKDEGGEVGWKGVAERLNPILG